MEILAIIGATVLFFVIVGVLLWQLGVLKVEASWDDK